MRMRRLPMVILMAGVMMMPVMAQRWEETEHRTQQSERTEGEDIAISTRDGYIYVTTSRAVIVKLFSILGQLISQENLPSGTHRLRVATRGVFILKAGTVTRRITL